MPKITVPGQWYFVVDCSVCGKPVPLAEAPSPDEKPDPLEYRTIFQFAMPPMRLCRDLCAAPDVTPTSRVYAR